MISSLGGNQKPLSDYIGVLSSMLCLAHCLVTPFILSLQVYLMRSIDVVEYIFLAFSFFAVFFSSKKYPKIRGKVLIWGVFGILAASVIFHESLPSIVSYIAAIGLVFLHLKNIIWNKNKKTAISRTKNNFVSK